MAASPESTTEAETPGAVGTVAELWRFPVKSLQGEPLTTATLTTTGIVGDRAWGIVDPATGQVLSAKTVPGMLDAAAVTTDNGVRIRLPDGTAFTAGDAGGDDILSDWLGRPVVLQPARPELQTSYQMSFDPPDDGAELFDIPSPTGTFFDLAGIHLLTTGSLATAEAEHPEGVWTSRRFRPNILVTTPEPTPEPGPTPGSGNGETAYPEDAWVDGHLDVGSARLTVLMRTVRCALPLRAQPADPTDTDRPALPRDITIFRTLARIHDNHLGIYADVTSEGAVTLGDPLRLFPIAG